ncbi:MAG TPA: peroxide stress protein YaaA [Saprospiraceae bacterium]|nr:peroxide stress protein YaaA [Saprospiraceae bacterium]
MLYVLSPAKNINEDVLGQTEHATKARLLDHSRELLSILREKEEKELRELFNVSEDLSQLNYERYQNWKEDQAEKLAPALKLFNGSVFQNMNVETLSSTAWAFAKEHLRILSGLYGVLRPMDAIQPYRLEMGTKMQNDRGKNLYEFWGDRISEVLTQDLEDQQDQILINLASKEYFRAVKKKAFPHPIIDISFKEEKDGKFKTFGFNAKMARGKFTRFVLENEIDQVENLKAFDVDDYSFNEELSSEKELVFTR